MYVHTYLFFLDLESIPGLDLSSSDNSSVPPNTGDQESLSLQSLRGRVLHEPNYNNNYSKTMHVVQD